MSPALQVKLLRVLQEGEYERVGGTKTLNADVRIISASNQDVAALVKAGGFRADLFYRLNVIQLRVPALRERIDDIPLLASHFLALYAEKNEKQVRGIQAMAMERLIAHHWPGNVRELENALERSVVLCRTEVIEVNDLPPALRQAQQGPSHISFEVGTPLKDIERSMIEETLRQCGGDRKLAASLLGITSRTIYRREAEWTLAEMPEEEANPNP
jgi:two-component system response regulator HydG